jgi:hypothetical protein
MFQVVSHWAGFTGAPGFTNFYFIHSDPPSTGAQNAVTNTANFWSACAAFFPTTVSITVDPLVKVVEDTDGELVDVITVGTAPPGVSGTLSGQGPSPAGACINWATTTIHGSRRIRGRTFLVPIAALHFGSAGSIGGSAQAGFQAAASGLRTATGPTLGIWSRPRDADPTATPPVTARTGLIGPVTGNSVPSKAVVLRSRRD